MAELHSVCAGCSTSDLKRCEYQNPSCIFNLLFIRTGHGPVVKAFDPPRLLLYGKSSGPGDEPMLTMWKRGPDDEPEEPTTLKEDHFNISDYRPGTTVQTVMQDLRKGTVPLDADLRKKVDDVLEELIEGEERVVAGQAWDGKRDPDLNQKARQLEEALRRKEDFWEDVELRKSGKSGDESSDDSEASTVILPESSKTGEPAGADADGEGKSREL